MTRSLRAFPVPAAPAGAAAGPAREAAAAGSRWGLLECFVLLQVLAPALLYFPGMQDYRVPIRVLPFAAAIAGLALILRARADPRPHPAWIWLLAATAYLALMIVHPHTNSTTAGVAQVAFYVAAWAPVMWVPYLVRSDRQLVRVLGIVLVCNGINAGVGVMQVIDPVRWLPAEFSELAAGQYGLLSYSDDQGREIVRPPGLSDNPGAVCGPATAAAFLGFVALSLRVPWWAKGVALGFAGFGFAAILLSQVRTNFLILLGMVACYALVLFVQREYRRATTTVVAVAAVALISFSAAAALGGRSVTDRFASLLEDDPLTVYYYKSARGYMTHQDTLRYLAAHPLGAGLGRWGMMRVYFGDENNVRSPPLWAEVQLAAWALDGGVVLIVVYLGAVGVNTWYEFSVARRARDPSLRRIAAIVLAHNLGTAALVLSFTPFTTQVGVMYWLMAGLLHGAVLLRQQHGVAVTT